MTNPERVTATNELASSGVFEIPPLPEWFHEPGIESQYRPWQHTPLNPYSTQVRGHQKELREIFQQLASNPPREYEGKGLEELVELNILAGMATRETLCMANFADWESNHREELEAILQDSVMEWLLGEGLAGHGSARSQLELLRRAPSLRSLDLQVLTTPFGYRYEYVESMHEELYAALADLDAVIFNEPQWLEAHPPKIAVDPVHQAQSGPEPRGILVTFKRKIAEVQDPFNADIPIGVLRREAWLLPTYQGSGFSPDILATMWQNPSWERDMKQFAERSREYIMQKIASGQGAIPLSVATYATR